MLVREREGVVTFIPTHCAFKNLLYLGAGTEEGKEMFYLTTHSTHFIYGYMASDILLSTILIVRKETC